MVVIGNIMLMSLTVYSMVTHDGRRMVSQMENGQEKFALVATNDLPKDVCAVRPWRIYCVKATHTDIGLHNPQYIQRHGAVKRIEDAMRLVDADARTDEDPAAYRYVMEGMWFWENYPMDRGEGAAWNVISNYVRRGRIDIACSCAGNHTHVMGAEELRRSALTKLRLLGKWGVTTRTMIMADNPGMSWSIVKPYVEAGIDNVVFAPNQWNPHVSTIRKMNRGIFGAICNPDAKGGGNYIDVSYDSESPMVFRWESPDRSTNLLVWCSTQYGYGLERVGIRSRGGSLPEVEMKMPGFLAMLERKYPYDLWLACNYGDDEGANTGFADFAAEWNAKWKWPQFVTVGRLDEPFDELRRRFGSSIPTVRGEMTSGWLQHVASAPELLADKLAAERLLTLAERAWRADPNRNANDGCDIDRAWWYLILNDEHSYGTSGYQGRRVFETWMQHRDWIERAEAVARRIADRYGVKRPEPQVEDDGVRIKENEYYRVEVNERGEILSIYDKELGRNILDGVANRFLYTRDNHKSWADESLLGARITRKVSLAKGVKRIDIEDTFEHATDLFNTRRYCRFGYLAFPFAVPNGRFMAMLGGGEVIDPYRDQSGYTTDAYVAVRDWCAVENEDFGIALRSWDSMLTEFGEIHPDKTCFTGVPPAGKTTIYPYLFTDWLQMHQPDGESMNFRFRFSIVSYTKGGEPWRSPARGEASVVQEPLTASNFPEPRDDGWTGLVESPRAGHGEKDGQMYVLWGAEMSPDFDHYELYRDGTFLANVTNEVYDGIPYRVARYEDVDLPTHTRHEYQLRKVWKDRRKDALCAPFSGLTRFVGEEERNGVVCEGEYGRLSVRYDGATVTSWKPESLKGREVFFMPEKTPWGEEVHGGLPICWPWFGKRKGCPKHGLARYMKWRFEERIGKDGVVLETTSTPETMKVWPHPFKLRATLLVDGPNALTLKFTETNTGKTAYESAFGVHPYFAVADACDIAVDGERLPKPWVIKEFAADGKSHKLQDFAGKVAYSVESSGNDTWYVWNPGVERTPLCETLGPDEWKRFCCLEPFMQRPLALAPGESREHVVRIAVSGL